MKMSFSKQANSFVNELQIGGVNLISAISSLSKRQGGNHD